MYKNINKILDNLFIVLKKISVLNNLADKSKKDKYIWKSN